MLSNLTRKAKKKVLLLHFTEKKQKLTDFYQRQKANKDWSFNFLGYVSFHNIVIFVKNKAKQNK